MSHNEKSNKRSSTENLSSPQPLQQTLITGIDFKENTTYETIEENTIALQSFQKTELEGPSQLSPVYEDMESSHKSHYELDDEEAEKKGESGQPQYMSVVSTEAPQTSHYELDDEETEKKGQEEPKYMFVVPDKQPHVSSLPTTRDSMNNPFNKI